MGVKTPNIDRIGREGLRLTSFFAQPSCTAGRAAFITGQLPVRTGLTTVGTPGSPAGLQKEDVTLAEILKTKGYSTAQFGKNHLGDLEEHLPHRHGFDEFFGNLYHLNGNEDLEDPDRPTDPAFRKKFDPRGVVSGTADGPTVDEGPLTVKRMEITGKIEQSSRNYVFYYDETVLTAIRYKQVKVTFSAKMGERWDSPLQSFGRPLITNLLMDPFERQLGDLNRQYAEHKAWVLTPILGLVQKHLSSFREYPVRQLGLSADVGKMIEGIQAQILKIQTHD